MTPTEIILLINISILIIYDIYAILKWNVDATISRTTLRLAKAYPIIPFALGIVCGHFFWSQTGV